jgi:hypothetical protein
MNEKINPVGLKGYQVTERMKELMGIKTINENKKTSVVELTKRGPDGNVYGIVRENHEYYIKITKKQNNLVVEDFQYMGGLQNKKQEVYPSYAKAIKHLNLKFHSLNEAYGKSGQVNVFLDDKLLKEDYAAFESMSGSGFKAEGNMEGHMTSECCGAQTMGEMCMECGGPAYGGGMNEFDKPAMDSMKKQYGDEKGEKVYYATANKQDRNPETFEKNEGIGPWSRNDNDTDDMTNYNQELGTSMYDTNDDWVDVHGDDEDLVPEMAAVHGMMEKEFPDLTGDGKVTRADILKGRGVDLNKENEEAHMENEGVDGGEIRRFDRHEQMDGETRGEILDTINEFYLLGGNFSGLKNYLFGLFDGYDYSKTDRFQDEMNKLKIESPDLHNRIENIYKKIDNYSFTNYEGLTPEIAAVDRMMEKDLSPAQEKIAKLDGDPDEIGADDLAALRAGKMNKKNEGKLSIERAMSMMDEMIDELQESRSKKKI